MKTTNHTPGPWTVDDGMIQLEDQSHILLNNIGTESEWVCVGLTDEEGFAEVVSLCHPVNAHLIAAAPDLLSVLKEAIEYLETFACHDEQGRAAIKSANAAIAKAEGKQ